MPQPHPKKMSLLLLLLPNILFAIFSLCYRFSHLDKTTPSLTPTSPPPPTSVPTPTNRPTTFTTTPTPIPSTNPPAAFPTNISLLIPLAIAIALAIFGLYKFARINKKIHASTLTLTSSSPATPLPTVPSTPLLLTLPSTPTFSIDSTPIFITSPTASPSAPTFKSPYNLRARPTKRSGKGWELWCEKQRSTRGAKVGEKRKCREQNGVARKRSRTALVLEDIVV